MPTDIVVDTCSARLYGSARDPAFVAFFTWVRRKAVLALSQSLLREYHGTGNRQLLTLIDELGRDSRLSRVTKAELAAFAATDRYAYTCNGDDVWHARLVFLTARKRLVSNDKKLVSSVNKHPKVGGVRPFATGKPVPPF